MRLRTKRRPVTRPSAPSPRISTGDRRKRRVTRCVASFGPDSSVAPQDLHVLARGDVGVGLQPLMLYRRTTSGQNGGQDAGRFARRDASSRARPALHARATRYPRWRRARRVPDRETVADVEADVGTTRLPAEGRGGAAVAVTCCRGRSRGKPLSSARAAAQCAVGKSDDNGALMASTRPRLGVVFQPDRPIEELPDFARQAERAGFDELWVVEDCFLHGGLVAAATALAASSRLVVGVGLLPVSVRPRHRGDGAGDPGTSSSATPPRRVRSWGGSLDEADRRVTAGPDRRARGGRACRAVAARWRSGHDARTPSEAGSRSAGHAARQAPPLIGTTGERGIRLAGTIADGVRLPEGSGPEAVTWASRILGRRGATVVYAWLRIDEIQSVRERGSGQ